MQSQTQQQQPKSPATQTATTRAITRIYHGMEYYGRLAAWQQVAFLMALPFVSVALVAMPMSMIRPITPFSYTLYCMRRIGIPVGVFATTHVTLHQFETANPYLSTALPAAYGTIAYGLMHGLPQVIVTKRSFYAFVIALPVAGIASVVERNIEKRMKLSIRSTNEQRDSAISYSDPLDEHSAVKSSNVLPAATPMKTSDSTENVSKLTSLLELFGIHRSTHAEVARSGTKQQLERFQALENKA